MRTSGEIDSGAGVTVAPPSGEDRLRARIAELESEIDGLRRALRTRTVIAQATGLLAAVGEQGPQQGFQLLVELSQQYNVKLHTLAQQVVDLSTELGPRRAATLVGAGQGPELLDATGLLVRAHQQLVKAEGTPDWDRRRDDVVAASRQLCERLLAAES
ncbi:ANTAR domain-containing protein [Kutzneria buriramensis]|uniref:ANTAR domain-containing protein n=1 Tax=Kutzneria buriramensis TaxID=1045776 RepID=A0A3E0I0A8_9PSEU|nr:ANTAR domain-containing protein [Kutzneria buriramensis]REH51976.1 ANTAR domain-containing protein [Kutzneria buriramensis]